MRKLGARGSARRCMPVSEWPAIDQALRQQAVLEGDIIDGGGPLADLRPATLRFLDQGYGRWLTWLDGRGELDPAEPPAARATPERVSLFVRDLLLVNSTKTVRGRLAGLHCMVCALDPGHDLSHVLRHIARVRARHKPVRNKAAQVVSIDELYQLGLTLMATAPQHGKPRWGAVQFRDGLYICVLVLCPERSDNMRTLELGKTFICENGRWWIRLPASITKDRKPFAAPVPEALNAAIEAYRAYYRPMLLERRKTPLPSGGETALWISLWGLPMSAVYQPVTKVTRKAFGRPVNPHLFRDCASTWIATTDPEHVRITAPVLGHAGMATSEACYNQADNYQAAELWQDYVQALRRQPVEQSATMPD